MNNKDDKQVNLLLSLSVSRNIAGCDVFLCEQYSTLYSACSKDRLVPHLMTLSH